MTTLEIPDTADGREAIEFCFENGWTDGLPVVPPTTERVTDFLRVVDYDPDYEFGPVPPRSGMATTETIAANAVMAGCKPEYFPVVLSAVEAILDPSFNLNGVQATTHCCTPLVIVSGPVVDQLGINSGAGCFGSGHRANATIGRAVRLVMTTLGGAIPGQSDKSTFGHPGKFTYCIGERSDANPWQSIHEDRGFAPSDSVVTVFAGEAPHHAHDHTNTSPHLIAGSIADVMNTRGNNNTWLKGEIVIVVGPEHADSFANSGWTKSDLQYFLFDKARKSISELRLGGRWTEETFSFWPRWIDHEDGEERLPIVSRPEDIIVTVAGGKAGRFSAVIPGWGALGTSAVSRLVPTGRGG